MKYETIEYESQDHTATITMNRPDVLNALNGEMREEMSKAFDAAGTDPEIRVVIITGAGRAFSSGADLKDIYDRPDTAEGWRERYLNQLTKLIDVWNFRKPVIAAVKGYALGEGCDLALAADMTIASYDAQFGWPEVRMPGMEFLLMAPWLMGMKRAKELLLTGDMIDGQTAERYGLVNRAVQPEELLEESRRLAARVAKMPLAATRRNKLAVNRAFEAMGIVNSWWYNHELAIQCAWDREQDREERDKLVKEKGLKAYFEQRDSPFGE